MESFTRRCAKIASYIKGKKVEEIRERFHIASDFSPEEEARVRIWYMLLFCRFVERIDGQMNCNLCWIDLYMFCLNQQQFYIFLETGGTDVSLPFLNNHSS